MSSFAPLNLNEDLSVSKKDLEEEYTRELAIEQAFKTFEVALKLQKQQKYLEAYFTYKELFNLEVISNHYFEETEFLKGIQNGGANNLIDELSFLSPNVKSLRYLVFRNRGFLNYEMLKQGHTLTSNIHQEEQRRKRESAENNDDAHNEVTEEVEDISAESFFKELFYVMIDDFIICLIYQEADEELIQVIYKVFTYLDIKRLIRFTLEYTLNGPAESDDVVGLLPVNVKALKLYNQLLGKLHDSNNSIKYNDKKLESLQKQLEFLNPIKVDFLQQIERIRQKTVVEIPIRSSLTWGGVIDDINKVVKNLQDKDRLQNFARAKIKDLDPYCLTESSIERIVFKDLPQEHAVIVDDEVDEFFDADEHHPDTKTKEELSITSQSPMPETVDDDNKSETDSPTQKANKPQIQQRSSKRLARNDSLSEEVQIIELTRETFTNIDLFHEFFDNSLKPLNYENVSLSTFNPAHVYVDLINANDENHGSNPKDLEDIPLYAKDFFQIIDNWKASIYTPALIIAQDNTSSDKISDRVGDDEKVKLLEVLSNFGTKSNTNNSGASITETTIPEITEYETSESISRFLKEISDSSYHFEYCKLLILERLLKPQFYKEHNERICLISDTIWPSNLSSQVKEWIVQSESFILGYWRNNQLENDPVSSFAFTVGIFEVLIDIYIGIKDQISSLVSSQAKKPSSKSARSNLSNLMVELVKFDDKIHKWASFIDTRFYKLLSPNRAQDYGLKFYLRYKWAKIFKDKAQNTSAEENKFVALQLQELSALVVSMGKMDSIHIALSNYENICEITLEAINYQAITSSVLSMFSKVLYTVDGNNEAIEILESILIVEDQSLTSEQKNELKLDENNKDTILTIVEGNNLDQNSITPIKAFLDKYPVDMKLNLWNILFSYYDEKNQYSKFQYGFERNMQFLLSYLNSDAYTILGPPQRLPILLNILSSFGDYLKTYLRHVGENGWKLAQVKLDELHGTLKNLLKFFEIFGMFLVHEVAASITSTKVSVKRKSSKAYDKLFDIFIEIICVVSVYYQEFARELKSQELIEPSQTVDELIHNLLTNFHHHLALFQLCDRADGLYLKLSQEILLTLKCSTEKELIQLISCRFHYSVNISDYAPVDHETSQSSQLDSNSTTELVKFILPLCFRKNPILYAPKADMKLLIDGLYEVVGEPDFEKDELLAMNNENFKYFIESTTITPKFLRDAFYGLVQLDFEPPKHNFVAVQSGLYYLQALLVFTSYKIRKKSMQSRAVELEHIIMLLKNDLIFCTRRAESWLLLGQAYGFLVEDDLIWTSDKLTIADRKISTANLQRKSLVCYLMAINQASSTGATQPDVSSTIKPVIGLLMSSFSKEAYNAIMEPMAMHAFKVQTSPRFVRGQFGASFVSVVNESAVKQQLVLKVIQQSLHIAIRAKPLDWTNYYYLSKVQRKLNKSPQLVLESLQRAAFLAKKHTNSPDPIIEPHYRTCSVLYKYVKSDKLSSNEALGFIANDSVISPAIEETDIQETQDISKKQFYDVITKCLRKVMAYDKKKWHHKPRYRLAKILFEEFDDLQNAKEEMSSMVTVKATSKTLVSIWKPENERPGVHFFYTYQYARFYIELLSKELNLISLIQMVPKLRRSNSTMISLYNAWESLCSTICRIIRSSLQVKDSFSENFLQSFSYQTFVFNSKSFLDLMKSTGVPDELQIHLCFLFVVNDMKKFNNGFGPTSLIDDTIVSIYIKIFLHFNHRFEKISSLPEADSPNGKVKKLAKRDIFPYANDILNIFRRDIEKILKDKPELYNDFVHESVEKQKLLESMTTEGLQKTPVKNANENKEKDQQVTPERPGSLPSVVTPENTVILNSERQDTGQWTNVQPAMNSGEILGSPVAISPAEINQKHDLDDLTVSSPKRPRMQNDEANLLEVNDNK